MWVITRCVAGPRLRLRAGVIACQQGDRVILHPLATTEPAELTVTVLGAGEHGITLLRGAGEPLIVARYPTARLARRQLRALVCQDGAGWATGLSRAVGVAVLLWLVWFLFFLPVELDPAHPVRGTVERAGTPMQGADPSSGSSSTAAAADAPAWIDDPATQGPPHGSSQNPAADATVYAAPAR